MDDRTFTTNNQVPSDNEPSDVLRQYIEALVEDVVLNGESFEAQKKWLRRYCELEHIDNDGLITNLSEFFDTMKELKSSASKTAVKLAYLQARDCYISTSIVDKLVESLAKGRSNNAEEKVGRGSAIGHDYVDLGLPSGTLWETKNEYKPDGTISGNPYFAFDEALQQFGANLPSSDQFDELLEECEWLWDADGEYEIVGPNGNSIILSGLGFEDRGLQSAFLVVHDHLYWTSDNDDSNRACYFSFSGLPDEDEYDDEDDGPSILDYSGFYWGDRRMGCAVRTVCQR